MITRPNKFFFYLIAFLSIAHFNRLHAQTELVTIQCNQPMDSTTHFMQGFVLGGTQMNIPLTQKLKPSFWEIGWDFEEFYDFIEPNFDTKIMASMYSIYMRRYTDGNPKNFKPWLDNWVAWDDFVDTLVNMSILTRPVDYWVIWGEPDVDFSGTEEQFVEMYRRTDSILHAIDPNAKLTGPDLISFNINLILKLVDTLDYLNIHLDAISWHEFGDFRPEDAYTHTLQLRDSLAVRPQVGNPLLFIPEYGIPEHRQIPGWSVGWIYYFEKAKLDWVSHGCFDEYDGHEYWDDCFGGGLDGMYMKDGITPQPLYWVYRAYAELNESGRIVATPSQPNTIAVASRNDVNQEMKMMVGRYDSPLMGVQFAPADVQIKIQNYPYGNNSIQPMVIQKIPAQTVSYSVPLLSPVTVFSGNVSFNGDSATISLPLFADGDVYIIYINPDSASVLQPNYPGPPDGFIVQLYPNPTNDLVTIATNEQNIQNITIYDVAGRVVYINSTPFSALTQIQVGTFANGVYVMRITNDKGRMEKKKFVVKH